MAPFAACTATLVVSFLLGSVPWGLVVSKVGFRKDLRQEGSGNIGTTNAIRSMGKAAGYLVFVLDFAKGILSGAVALALFRATGGQDAALRGLLLALAFSGCVWGHIFTPWLGFRGGKGIAVAVGCMFVAFGPLPTIVEVALFAVLVAATKRVSVGSIAAAALCPFMALWVFWGNVPAWLLCTAAALTVLWAHRANMQRLRDGTESRFGKPRT